MIRHANRPEISSGSYGNEVLISGKGIARARVLGASLFQRTVNVAYSSPIPRCQQTLTEISSGAGWNCTIQSSKLLGDPGPFVQNADAAGPLFLAIGAQGVVYRQLNETAALKGMKPTHLGVQHLLELIIHTPRKENAITLMVTHDAILAAFIGFLLGIQLNPDQWPDFLEGTVVWAENAELRVVWQGVLYRFTAGDLQSKGINIDLK
ncbi:MAG: histidine phosphatase family protein [Chlamydiia bacterium]|nr:histidine phosphatase family protein [Chlamydiia bacterium]